MGERDKFGLALNDLVAAGIKAPVVMGRDHWTAARGFALSRDGSDAGRLRRYSGLAAAESRC